MTRRFIFNPFLFTDYMRKILSASIDLSYFYKSILFFSFPKHLSILSNFQFCHIFDFVRFSILPNFSILSSFQVCAVFHSHERPMWGIRQFEARTPIFGVWPPLTMGINIGLSNWLKFGRSLQKKNCPSLLGQKSYRQAWAKFFDVQVPSLGTLGHCQV